MNLIEAFEQAAQQHSEKRAYTYENKSRTYKELFEEVTRFAAGLQKAGMKKGSHIALLLGNSPEFLVALYGALKAGLTVVPLNPAYTADELGYLFQNSCVSAAVLPEELLPRISEIKHSLSAVEQLIVVENKETMKEGEIFPQIKKKAFSDLRETDADFQPVCLSKTDTAVILYTSGTTGKPKGAMLTHENLGANARDTADYLAMAASDTVIAVLPMFHVFCLTVALNAPLLTGAGLVILPAFSPKKIFEAAREQATVFAGVPAMYNFLYQYADGSAKDFASMRLCVSGGAPMPVSLLENFERKFGAVISEGYGLSEASPVTAFNPLDRPRRPGSIGCSIPHVENKIVDAAGEEVPRGQVGELVVKGPNVMKGYYGMPEETAAIIKGGWLHTGDLARQDGDGYFYLVDRKKDLIITGGYNVYPREVEEVLYAHPFVQEAAVIGVPDRDYGEAVQAFVVANKAKLTKEAVQQHCRESLADYKVPKYVEFLEELPKNTTGKILRRSLKKQLLKE